jgi:hypothetical protein
VPDRGSALPKRHDIHLPILEAGCRGRSPFGYWWEFGPVEHHLSREFRCEKVIDRDVRNLSSGVNGPSLASRIRHLGRRAHPGWSEPTPWERRLACVATITSSQTMRTCLGRIATRSKASFGFPPLSRFSTTWGICFSLKGNPSRLNGRGFVTVLPRWCTSQVGQPMKVQTVSGFWWPTESLTNRSPTC